MASLRCLASLRMFKNVPKLAQLNCKVVAVKPQCKTLVTTNWNLANYKPRKNKVKHDPDTFGDYQEEYESNLNDSGTTNKNFGSISHTEFEPQDEIEIKEGKRLEMRTGEKRKRMIDYIFDIQQLGRAKKLKEALALYDHMLEINVKSDSSHLFVVVISFCGRAGYTKKAFQVYKQMRDRGFKPTPATLTGLFNSCANCPFPKMGLEKATNLRERMSLEGWHPNPITYQAMIKAFGRCGDMTTAFELVDEMREKKLPITSETFNFLLMSCISNKEAGFGYAIKVLSKMEKMRIKPDGFTFNLVLRTVRDCQIGPPELESEIVADYVKRFNKNLSLTSGDQSSLKKDQVKLIGEPGFKHLNLNVYKSKKTEKSVELQTANDNVEDNVLKIENQLQSTSIAPINEIVALKPIQTSEDRLMLLGGASDVLSKMEKLRVNPDIKTFTLLLISEKQTTENELALLGEMKRFNVKPDVDFFNLLIKQRAMTKRPKEARDVLDLIVANNLKVDIATFGTLALTVQKTSEAVTFLKDMDKAGFPISIQIMGTFADNALYNMNFKLATYVIMKMSLLKLNPDKKMIESLELARERGREIIYKVERNLVNKEPYFYNQDFKENYGNFCKIYATWLKSTTIEMYEHPWKQYKTIKDTE